MLKKKAPASPPGLSFTLCVSAGTEPGGKPLLFSEPQIDHFVMAITPAKARV